MPGGFLLWVGLAVTAIGACVAWLGWRGRRVGDHEVCRRCGYDLFGRPPNSPACAECGANLLRPSAIVVGHRRHRPVLFAAGIVVCVVVAGASGWVMSPWGRRVNWVRYEPAFWLGRDAEFAPSAADRAAAMGELLKRLRDGRLSAGAVSSVAERALRRQADVNTPWDRSWGTFMENARAVRLVTDAQWKRYLAGALANYQFDHELVASRRTGLVISVMSGAARIGNESVVFVRSNEQWEVSGIRLHPYGGPGYSVVNHVHRLASYPAGDHLSKVPLDDPALRALRPGPQTFSLKLTVEVFGTEDDAYNVAKASTILTRVFPFTTTWQLLPDEEAEPSPAQSPEGPFPSF
jgi:ribosomal protein L37E